MLTSRPTGGQSRGCFGGNMIRIGLEGEVWLDPDFEGSVEFEKWIRKGIPRG